ncbi:MAG TPA: formate/nitrite transporter family protein [Vicinamibacterales bacterium]|nr:formate/nitrite transporter family protein [Vicinamibacterales bacterium]
MAANERDEVHERSSPTGSVVYHAVKKEGEDELDRATTSLAWSGLAAGLSMGFSFAAEALLRTALPDVSWRPLVVKFGYSIGFLIVVLGRQQLFTENTLTVILPLLRRRDAVTVKNVLRLWAVVLVCNLIGAWTFAFAAGRSAAFDPAVRDTFAALGRESMASTIPTTLLRAVYAGWLIALMVWLLPFAETARVWVIVIITYIVGLGHFSHVIAGSVETFYLVVTGEQSFGQYVAGFLAPAFFGNVLGGVALVAAIAHAQFVAGPAAEEA